MGRRKIEMKKIEDKSCRQVTFSKRRSGLIKKAQELSVLCDVEVALVVFSSRGRLYEFCSAGNSRLSHLLERYQDCNASQTSTIINEAEKNIHSDHMDVEMCTELVNTVRRFLDGNCVEEHNLDEFEQLERQLDVALMQTRTQKAQLMQESVRALQEQERILREENQQLKEEVATLKCTATPETQTRINLGLNSLEDTATEPRPRPRETLPLLL